ncbi:MAG: ERCC4 domain-containing protein [Planctomycetota bacterium]
MDVATKPRRSRREPADPVIVPFTIIQDSREQNPWGFQGMIDDKGRALAIPVEVGSLRTGDYSIKGIENLCCVERKSAEDLFGSCTSGRERFKAEHVRMTEFDRAVVVIESDWATMLRTPPAHSRLSPLSVFRTSISWLVKYNIPWIACPGRRFAELTTFAILRKFYETEINRLKGEI